MQHSCAGCYEVAVEDCEVISSSKAIESRFKWNTHTEKFSTRAKDLGLGKYVVFEGGEPDLYFIKLKLGCPVHVLGVRITGSCFTGSHVRVTSKNYEATTLGLIKIPNDTTTKDDQLHVFYIPLMEGNGTPYVGSELYISEKFTGEHFSASPKHRCSIEVFGHHKTVCHDAGSSRKIGEMLSNQYMFNREALSDVVFEFVEGRGENRRKRTIFGHKAVLAGASEYFRTMFVGGYAEGSSSSSSASSSPNNGGVSKRQETKTTIDFTKRQGNEDKPYYQSCLIVLYYLYTGKLPQETGEEDFIAVLELAHEWMVQPLVDDCEARFASGVRDQNIVSFYWWSKEYDLKILKAKCIEYWKTHWERLVRLASVQEASKSFLGDNDVPIVLELQSLATGGEKKSVPPRSTKSNIKKRGGVGK